jgi:hypothetical protein
MPSQVQSQNGIGPNGFSVMITWYYDSSRYDQFLPGKYSWVCKPDRV